MDCSPPGSSVHGILQARILQWVAMPSSRWSSQPRGWIQVSCIPGRFFTIWAKREPLHPSYPGLIPGQGTKRPFFMITHCSLSSINTRVLHWSKTKTSGRGSERRWAMKPQIPYSLTWPGPKVAWGPHLPGRGLNSPLQALETSFPPGPVNLAEQSHTGPEVKCFFRK